MEKLLKYILENIVDHPDDVEITKSVNEYGVEIFQAQLNPEDMGKVIGKKGKIISSIRKILRVKAIKEGKRFQFNLIESSTKMD